MDGFLLERLAEFICGDNGSFAPEYRSGINLTRFFENAGLSQFKHDGTTRKRWVIDCLNVCSEQELQQVVLALASPKTYKGNFDQIQFALKCLNEILNPEGLNVELKGVKPVITQIEPRLSRPLNPNADAIILECPDFNALGMETEFSNLLISRWDENEKCIQGHAYLASIIMMGSLLEGVLSWALTKFPEKAYRAISCPKDLKTGKSKPISEWKLSQMIDVAHEIGWLGIDVKRFSHSLREFRNLVHPAQQLKEGASPDMDTCLISWQVVRASINDLAQNLIPLQQKSA